MRALWVKVRVHPDKRQQFLDAIEVDALGSERNSQAVLTIRVDPRRHALLSINKHFDHAFVYEYTKFEHLVFFHQQINQRRPALILEKQPGSTGDLSSEVLGDQHWKSRVEL